MKEQPVIPDMEELEKMELFITKMVYCWQQWNSLHQMLVGTMLSIVFWATHKNMRQQIPFL